MKYENFKKAEEIIKEIDIKTDYCEHHEKLNINATQRRFRKVNG